jgi:hypothetical protein
MEAKSAAIAGEIIRDIQSLAPVSQHSIHLVLQIIGMDVCIADFMQKDSAAVCVLGWLPNIEE